jgi:large subunit ribosomal protein L15
MLNVIKDNDGARKKYKALGRGIGSGKGKTSFIYEATKTWL